MSTVITRGSSAVLHPPLPRTTLSLNALDYCRWITRSKLILFPQEKDHGGPFGALTVRLGTPAGGQIRAECGSMSQYQRRKMLRWEMSPLPLPLPLMPPLLRPLPLLLLPR